METFKKQPREVLDYDVDMTEWFEGHPGDDIQSVTLRITSDTEPVPTLVAGPEPHPEVQLMGAEPVAFKVWLGGGTDFTDYQVDCLVKTEQDREAEIEFRIKVRDL